MGVYSAQYHENATEVSGIVESANGDDVFGCCSIVLQLDGNDGMMSFRRDSNYTADIKVEKINWHGIPVIKQSKEDQGYFTHVIITHDGWMIGMGGIDDGEDSKKCEDIAYKMINNDSSINKSCLKEIQDIKKPYGRGHVVVKAPNGNYGFANVNKLKTGTLEPGMYISIPNNYSMSRSGNLSLESDDLIKDMTELSQLDKYGFDRRDIITYDFHASPNNNTTDVYVANEDGSKLNVSYVDCVDDVYFNNQLTKAVDIPIAPDYKSLGSITFTDADLNSLDGNMVYIVLAGVVIFIIALSYGVYRFVRFVKTKFMR
ncbi:hypothetical protein [uncultured Methanobrevibacter sp.]|uniref:hypothetical protein n=1 Tax=uncultured Methanobrevibacter sp. TaxID=253161 RepID=UPI0025E547A9|nr:hypothetical protein [uncultured Methanobrevibacter sp.]